MTNLFRRLLGLEEIKERPVRDYALEQRQECAEAERKRQDMFCSDMAEWLLAYLWPNHPFDKEQMIFFVKQHFLSFLKNSESREHKHKYWTEIYKKELNLR